MKQGSGSVRSKSRGRGSKLRCYICNYEEHLKRDCPSVEQLLDWIIDSRGSYHMTYKRDYLFDFEEYDGGNVLLGDGRECRVWGTIRREQGYKGFAGGTIRKKKANCVYTLDGQAMTRKTLKGRKQLGEYQTGWIQQHNGLVKETNVTLLAKVRCFLTQSGLFKVFWADDTTMSTCLLNRSPSLVIRFKTLVDMLGFFGWLASIKQGMLERNIGWVISFGGTILVKVLLGVEFEVEPQEDHTFEVKPHGSVDHVVVACEVISKWNARLKEDMDARSHVYVLSNGCKESSDDINDYY
ncbi:zinc finger, CCHC-type containing protein [Tanacetum coccineum]